MFPVRVAERLAHQSGGVFYLRIEDTDAMREVEGAAAGLIRTLSDYGIVFDEGASLAPDGTICDKGNYGPYKQSQRADIYHVFAKKLVLDGRAYPCFTSEEELAALKEVDKKAEIKNKDWAAEAAAQREKMLAQREITLDEVKVVTGGKVENTAV
jgi:glutamyl-tRNA synthetase